MYYDYHSHTNVSEDAVVSADEMIKAAIKKNLCELAITDHFDPDYPDPDFEFEPDLISYHKMLTEKQNQYREKIRIVKGIEIGLQKGETLDRCKTEANSFSYDFIIASFHCFNGYDLFSANYYEMNKDRILTDFYECMYDCLANYNDYSVVGHFNVIDRYVPFRLDYAAAYEIIEEILKIIIKNGRGIEFNTSSFRYGMGNITTPSDKILKMYKELGGEIITIGSDAHRPDHIAMDFEKAKSILTQNGFKYFTTFESLKPTMINLR